MTIGPDGAASPLAVPRRGSPWLICFPKLVDVSRNYFAMNKRTNDVFHFGEDVDMNEEGTVVRHAGPWLSGVEGARAGLMVPGQMSLNARFYQKIAPGVALERAEIVSTNETVKTRPGSS